MTPTNDLDAQLARLARRFARQLDARPTEYLLTNLAAEGKWRVVLTNRRVFDGATPKEAVDRALDDDPLQIEVCGREIRLNVGPALDGCDAFRLSVSVDGKEQWVDFFNYKYEDEE